jgi:hypothetical protein
MLFYKVVLWLFSAKLLFCSCGPEKRESGFQTLGLKHYHIRQLGHFPAVINESSGLAWATDTTLWTHNDGRNGAYLYEVSLSGKLLHTHYFPKLVNRDWEDLAQDPYGNLYIGDIGNNFNDKKALHIYKLNLHKPSHIDSITFSYADQPSFPPLDTKDWNYDSEAFFWMDHRLYLFSKNRGTKQVKVYVMPDTAGIYQLNPEPQTIFLKAQVTAADVSPDKSHFALLAYGKLYLFRLTDRKSLFATPYLCLKLARGQAEALVFKSNTELIISNEQGKLFRLQLEN